MDCVLTPEVTHLDALDRPLLQDQFFQAVPNATVMVVRDDGVVSGPITTDENGAFGGTLEPGVYLGPSTQLEVNTAVAGGA